MNRKSIIGLFFTFLTIGACQNDLQTKRTSKQTVGKNYSGNDSNENRSRMIISDSRLVDAKVDKNENSQKSIESHEDYSSMTTDTDEFFFNGSDDFKSFKVTKRLFDPVLNTIYWITQLKRRFNSVNYNIQLIDTAGGATTFILRNAQGEVLEDLGAVPYKEVMFPMVDNNLQFVAYTTSFDDGAEVQFLEVITGKIFRVLEN